MENLKRLISQEITKDLLINNKYLKLTQALNYERIFYNKIKDVKDLNKINEIKEKFLLKTNKIILRLGN